MSARILGPIAVFLGIAVVVFFASRHKGADVPPLPVPAPQPNVAVQQPPAVRVAKAPIVGAIILGNLISALLIAIVYAAVNALSH